MNIPASIKRIETKTWSVMGQVSSPCMNIPASIKRIETDNSGRKQQAKDKYEYPRLY